MSSDTAPEISTADSADDLPVVSTAPTTPALPEGWLANVKPLEYVD